MHRMTVLFVGSLCAFLFHMLYSGPLPNVLRGQVQAQIGDYTVIVTDCYRVSPPRIEHEFGLHAAPEADPKAIPAVPPTSLPAATPAAATPAAADGSATPTPAGQPAGPGAVPGADHSVVPGPNTAPAVAVTPMGPSDTWHFAPCDNAVIEIAGDQLTVNGVAYGAIAPGDTILVDRGVVYVNGHLRQST